MSLMLASVTDSLVTVATNAIDSLGLPGVALFMGLTATGVAFPGEATMLFAGFDVSDGHLSLAGILIAAWLGDLIGCLVGYAVGHYGREGILERHGAKVHLGPHRLQQGDRWFERHGAWMVLFGRSLPIVRSLVAITAGAARYPLPRFALLSAIGSIPFIVAFGLIGRSVGSNWVQWKDQLHYVDYAVLALIVCAIAYLVLRRRAPGDAPA